MTDVNVTEKVARALYALTARFSATHDEAVVPWGELHPVRRERWLAYAKRALAVLADPEVLAGKADAMHADECPEDPDEGEACRCDIGHYDRQAAAVVEWLTGGAG